MNLSDWAHFLTAAAGALAVIATWSQFVLKRMDEKNQRVEKMYSDLNEQTSAALKEVHDELQFQLARNDLLLSRVFALEGFLAAQPNLGELPDTPGWPLRLEER
jgi:hypothetical protein